MIRISSIACFGLVLIAPAARASEDMVTKQLAVQTAMSRARSFLSELKSQKAVEVLEEQLPKVNGNPHYLVLLRESYRACIRDLYLAGQPDLAARYLERLCILDPSAAHDSALRPNTESPPRKFTQEPAKVTGLPFPNFGKFFTNPFAKKEEPKTLVKDPVARARGDDASVEDPFSRANQRENSADPSSAAKVRESLSRGMNDFNLKRYAEARQSFEEAYRADPSSLATSREAWAYAIIDGVSKSMAMPGALPAQHAVLHKQVEGAIEMAPGKMMAVGKSLLQELDRRAKLADSGRPTVTAAFNKVKHLGRNKEGWLVAETPHFRLFHKQDQEFAERVADIAETTRLAMFRKWFDTDGIAWDPICELILHPDVNSYSQMTGAPRNTPGHSRMEVDNATKRIIARRMDLRCDIPSMTQTVLPHEATHVVLAGMFGPFDLPRWADEGIAVLAEPNEKIDEHRRNLLKHHQDGHLFGIKELMKLENYPEPRRIGAFYAQSVVLVEFLTQQRGPKVLAEFVKDGLRHGYETSLQRHYGMTFPQLETHWQQHVISSSARVAVQK